MLSAMLYQKRLTWAALLAATVMAAPAFADGYTVGTLTIEGPWTRATPTGAKVAGGFMTIRNTGNESDVLVGGSSPIAGRIEIHEMSIDGGMMRMRELPKGLEIKPGQSVELKPGSYHIMFMDLKESIKAGERINGTLVFQKAGPVNVHYKVEAMGSRGSTPASGHSPSTGKSH